MSKRTIRTAAMVLTVLIAAGPAFAMNHGGGQNKMELNQAQAKMHEAMGKVKADNKQLFEQMKAKKKEMRALMKAEKFDKVAYLAKHKEMQTIKNKMMEEHVIAKADVLSKMSLEERSSLRMRPQKRGKHMRRKSMQGMEPVMAPSE